MKQTQGAGKVILFGEHAVVYGIPAVAVALDRGAVATLQEGPPEVSVPALGLRFTLENGEPQSRGLDKAIVAILQNQALPGSLTLSLEIPPSRGLGSSASLCVAVARMFATEETTSIIEAASRGERIFHGNPSGVDVAASVYGGSIVFTKGQPPIIEPIHSTKTFSLLIADSGQRGVTAEIVARIREQREANPARVDAIFRSIGDIVVAAKGAFATGDLALLGALFNDNHQRLFELGLSTEKLERGCNAARKAGALGAKLTGAGAGGCLIALSEASKEEPIREALVSAGFSLVNASLSI